MFERRHTPPVRPQAPPRAVRATVLRINEDGSATAKPLDFERRHTWQPVFVPRREVKRLGILPGMLLEFELDDRGAITRTRKVFQ
jgi:hypothetical protein